MLAGLNKIDGCPYVFSTNGKTPASGFSKWKAALDARMLTIARAEAVERGADPEQVSIPGWRLHDLRRTAASGMGRLGVSLPVIEKILNHTSGSFGGIVGVYQLHGFSDEKRQALENWAGFITALIAGRNVVPIRARAY